jgi:hypothetical protein
MERRVPIMEKRGARFYGDYLPFLRLENIEIHRYVCFRCGHFETFQFDPMSYVRKPTPFKKK